jgi:magnesium transporter
VPISGGAELLDAQGVKWIDVEKPTEDQLKDLAARFGLHRLAIEDCLHLDQRPKLEDYPGHEFIVMQSFTCKDKNLSDFEMDEMHFFLGDDWVISVHENGMSVIESVRKRLAMDPAGTLGRGADFFTYVIADELVDRNFPILDSFSDALEDLEAEVFEAPDKRHLQKAFELRRMLLTFRRVLSPQRDVIGLLARRGIPHVKERTALYFRDVYDHLVRLYEGIDATRDLLGNVMDAYLSVVANRTNDITKQLTIFATIFLPLSFITGFFGQNFEVLSGRGFFWAMLVAIVGLPLGLLAWFRRRDWL